jgi:hypothetical protein
MLRSRIAANKPLLTRQADDDKRLAFAKKYRHWTVEDLRRVMYSDESMFRCLRATRIRVRRPAGSYIFSIHGQNGRTSSQLDSVCILYWCLWMCLDLFPSIKRTMNGECYQKVHEDHLLPIMGINCSTHLLQDGGHCAISWQFTGPEPN